MKPARRGGAVLGQKTVEGLPLGLQLSSAHLRAISGHGDTGECSYHA